MVCKSTNTADLLRKSGDTVILLVTVRATEIVDGEEVCVEQNISTATAITYKLARSIDDTLSEIIVSKTLGGGIAILAVSTSNPNNSQYTITISASDTGPLLGNFYHESQLTDASANVITTFSSDNVEFCKNLP